MATARLVPSSYTLSNTQYLSVSSASNMYTNTDSTTYATVNNSRSATTSYYIYIQGFNFGAVPADAIVSDIAIKLNAYHSGGNTSTIYCYDGTSTQITAAGSTTALGTSATVKTFTNTTIDWDTLKEYGSDFGIRINCRRSSRNTASYIYIYGAEIEVTYTLPVYHSVTTTNNTTGTVVPTGTTSVTEGDSHTVTISGLATKPTVTDNNVDVTSQLVEMQSGTQNLVPDSTSGKSGYTVTNESNGYHGSDNTTYASLELNGGTTGNIYYEFPALNLPSGSTISSISCSATYQYNRNGSSSGYSGTMQLYSGNTAKGSSYSLVSAGGTDVAKTTINLTVGSWSAADLADAKLRISCTNNASSTHRFLYFYGATLTVTFTISGTAYTYTITNITADHTIVVSPGATPSVPPVITVGTPSRTIISDEPGVNVCTCTFTSDLALQAWEARATLPNQTPARGVGLLVESGTTLAAGTPATVEVIYTELTNGDGEYTIKVYGQSTGGVWSE